MKKKNTFWISSAPRTGSMWLFNITREILKESGYEVYPKIIPQYDKKMLDIYYKEALPDQNDLNKYVFKVHGILKPDTPRSKILTTIRDPRDICISFKEFMKTDFKSSLKATKSILNFTKIYNHFEKDYLMILKCENIGKKPIDTMTCDDLGVDISSKLKVVHVDDPPVRPPGIKVEDVDSLVDKLKNEACVI